MEEKTEWVPAPCHGKTSLFVFGIRKRSASTVARVKAICATCPTATHADCLARGMVPITVWGRNGNSEPRWTDGGLPLGVFGGLTQVERTALLDGDA